MEILITGQNYLLMIVFVFTTVGLIKEYQLFNSLFYYVKQVISSNKVLVGVLSALGGILPISGRVTVSAGLLDTIAPTKGSPGRAKYGIIDYIATHHYYVWSPLEKTILLPMAAFGMSYAALMATLWPLLTVSLLFIVLYIWLKVDESDVVVTPITDFNFKISEIVRNVVPMIVTIVALIHGAHAAWAFGLLTAYYCLICKEWSVKKLISYVNWEVIVLVALVIAFGNFVKLYNTEVTEFIKHSNFDITNPYDFVMISLVALISGLLFGSSSKFAALSVLLTQVFGFNYFIWFFALEYAGYLLSPAHKCLALGKSYFGTPIQDYLKALGLWALVIILTAGVILYSNTELQITKITA